MKRSNTIRLTESRLYGMIREAVKNVLMESTEEDDYESTGYAGKDGEIFRNPKNGHVKKVKRGSKYKTGQNKVGDYVSTGYADKNGKIFHNPKNGHIKRVTESRLRGMIHEAVKNVLTEVSSETLWDDPKSFHDMNADMKSYGNIDTLKALASFFNRNGTPSEGFWPKNLPPYMKEVQVLTNNFRPATPGDMVIISEEEPGTYIYFEEDDYGAGYASVGYSDFSEEDYKDW